VLSAQTTTTHVVFAGREGGKTMMQVYNEMRQSHSRVNEIVADVLSTTVLVLAGIVAVAQFAYY
jgi:hypothetical protein